MSGALEYIVVLCQINGSVERGFHVDRYPHGRFPTVAAAKRDGFKRFGHDDFNIAEVTVKLGVPTLRRWTWMGETIEESPEVLADIAESLGWAVSTGEEQKP